MRKTHNHVHKITNHVERFRFEITCWQGTENITKKELMENIKGKFAILCYNSNTIDKEVIEAAGTFFEVHT